MQATSSNTVDTTANNQATKTKAYDRKDVEIDNNHGELKKDDFMKLFVTQLKNQDPLSPMDDSQMMQQTATFSQVDLLTSMEKSLTKMAEGAENVNNQQMMMSAAGYIGKMVEFEGNNIYLQNGAAPLSFDPEGVPFKTEIVIHDAKGNYVRTLKPSINTDEKTTLYWDGTDAAGNKVANGKYTFGVVAKGVDGEEIKVKKYGNGVVTGVMNNEKGIVYDVDGSEVMADKIVSVRNLNLGGVS